MCIATYSCILMLARGVFFLLYRYTRVKECDRARLMFMNGARLWGVRGMRVGTSGYCARKANI